MVATTAGHRMDRCWLQGAFISLEFPVVDYSSRRLCANGDVVSPARRYTRFRIPEWVLDEVNFAGPTKYRHRLSAWRAAAHDADVAEQHQRQWRWPKIQLAKSRNRIGKATVVRMRDQRIESQAA
jgi:hypothetical protein